jgi:hypothetical protein
MDVSKTCYCPTLLGTKIKATCLEDASSVSRFYSPSRYGFCTPPAYIDAKINTTSIDLDGHIIIERSPFDLKFTKDTGFFSSIYKFFLRKEEADIDRCSLENEMILLCPIDYGDSVDVKGIDLNEHIYNSNGKLKFRN